MAQEMMSARPPSWTVGRSQTQDGVDCRRGSPEVGSLVTLASQMRRPRHREGCGLLKMARRLVQSWD